MEKVTPRAARALRHKTQQQVADKIGITKQGYAYKEQGKQQFKASEMMLFCDYLEFRIDQILWGETD